jgi:hypothetical protein
VARLPDGRRQVISAVRDLVNANLAPGFEEGTGYAVGMVTWTVPAELSPKTYNNRPLALAALGNRQHYMSLYLMQLAHDRDERHWFEQAWRRTGLPLRLGKATLSFRSLDDLALDVVAEHIRHTAVDDLIAAYERGWARLSGPADP